MKRLLGIFAVLMLAVPLALADRGTMPSVRKQIYNAAKSQGVLTNLDRPTIRLARSGNKVTATIYSLKGGGPMNSPARFRDAVERATFKILVGNDGGHAVKQSPWKNIYVPRP